MNGYFLKGSKGEYLLVIRSPDIELMRSVISRFSKMREPKIKEVAKELEFSLENLKDE